MSIEQTNVVDFIGIEESTGRVVLTISDHLPWDDDEHFPLLQEKLNRYLAFIESGEIHESYPEASGRMPVIDLVLKHRPGEEVVRLLELAKEQIEGGDIEFRYGALMGEERGDPAGDQP